MIFIVVSILPRRVVLTFRPLSLTFRPLNSKGRAEALFPVISPDTTRNPTMPQFKDVTPPAGDTISISGGRLSVPDRPIIPFIEGDGTGPDIWRASVRVFDAAVQKAYGGKRKIAWFEVL